MIAETQHKHTTSVNQITCPGCGASLQTVHPRAQEIACSYCGSVLDAQSEDHQVLRKLAKPAKHIPFSFIKLGQMATFNGRRYQVIARTRHRMKYKEYWSEDGESGYSNEVWIFDEWLLMDENRTYFYLIEDREGFWIAEEIYPELPMLMTRNKRMRFYEKQRNQIVREYGGMETVFFEGESNYRIQVGDKTEFAMFSDRGIKYSAEWRMKAGKEIDEIEFFKEKPISRRKVVEAFEGNPEIDELHQTAQNWNFIYKVAMGAAIVLGLLILKAWISGSAVYDKSINLADLPADNSGFTTQTIELEPGLYQWKIEATEWPQGMEQTVFIYILDEAGEPINTLGESFYFYQGYDDEGSWTEKELSTTKKVRISEPSKFSAKVFAERELQNRGVIRITIRQGIVLTRYLMIALILCLGFAFMINRRRTV
ncbi:hypothetical protein [Pontibacter sp. G13]|uniref:hypothetical protein n=1 Tax=Pontibacter sp. G13 TaxID=3074898 RepID=UPI00288BD8A2|nr:hypothetical protein [Pontibacter sp. G13]WNJ15950.1 hypothetical protein RJD25_13895 [Pontibacter sp. G13]